MKASPAHLLIVFLLIVASMLAATQPPRGLPESEARFITLPWSIALALVASLSAWLCGWFILRYEHLHAHFSHDHHDGPQKYHLHPTPRIGGLAILGGLLAAEAVLLLSDAVAVDQSYRLLLLTSLPVFLGGLIEDVTRKVGVFERLMLAMCSAALAAWLLGAAFTRLDVPGLDQAMHVPVVAIAFTLFAVGGITNAFNIIDGYHGLAGGVALIVLAAFALLGYRLEDALILYSALGLAGSLLGFLVWNWPRGQIFLGDGGAYLVGFFLAEISALLVMRHPDISPWCPVVLLIYPIFETIYSIYRRKIQHKLSPGQPDNKHLHQLIHDKQIPPAPRGDRNTRNGQVAKYLWGPTALLAVLGLLFAESTPALMVTSIVFGVVYHRNYRRLVRRKNPG